jgi:hypothetical protein
MSMELHVKKIVKYLNYLEQQYSYNKLNGCFGLCLSSRSAVLNLGSTVDRFPGVRELGWGKNYKFIFSNLY